MPESWGTRAYLDRPGRPLVHSAHLDRNTAQGFRKTEQSVRKIRGSAGNGVISDTRIPHS